MRAIIIVGVVLTAAMVLWWQRPPPSPSPDTAVPEQPGRPDAVAVSPLPTAVTPTAPIANVQPADPAAPVTDVNPAIVWDTYHAAAEAGDAEAQLLVALAISRCLALPRNRALLDNMLAQSQLSDSQKQAMQAQFDACEPLLEAPGIDSLRELRPQYLAAAAAAGQPFARLHVALTTPDDESTQSELSSQLPSMFRTASDSPWLLPDAYLSRYGEWRTEDRMAWAYLWCSASPSCNPQQTLAFLQQQYHGHEVDDIVATAEAYAEAIEREEWGAIYLDIYEDSGY